MSLNGISNQQQRPVNVQAKNELIAEFKVNGESVKLTPNIVRDYLVSGNKENVSFQELTMFINLCKFNHLNPWLKEAYCIKYGSEPATMVVSKEAYLKRADSNSTYDGFKAGVVVMDNDSGEVFYRNGAIVTPNETLLGGFAEVFDKSKTYSVHTEVSLNEYMGTKKDGTPNSNWAKRPASMIRKVALVQALREAYPNTFGSMYIAEEQGMVEEEIKDSSNAQEFAQIDVKEAQVVNNPQPQQTAPQRQENEQIQAANTNDGWDNGFRFN